MQRKSDWLQKNLSESKYFLAGGWLFLFLGDLFCLLYAVVLGMETGFCNLKMNSSGQFLFVISCVVLFILLFLALAYIKFVWKKESRLQQDNLQRQLEQSKTYQLLLQQKMEHTKQEQVLFHQQMAQIKKLIAENDSQGLYECVYRLTSDGKKTVVQRLTGKLLLDILCSEKLQQAQEKKVKLIFDYQPNVCQKQVDEYDFYLLLGNLLDNAIEAAADSTERWVECEMQRKNDYWDLLAIRNSCDTAPTFANGVPVSQRGEGHGYGVKIVQRKVQQYHGDCMFAYDAERKVFSVHILLPM